LSTEVVCPSKADARGGLTIGFGSTTDAWKGCFQELAGGSNGSLLPFLNTESAARDYINILEV
jgi:hypothetical protein